MLLPMEKNTKQKKKKAQNQNTQALEPTLQFCHRRRRSEGHMPRRKVNHDHWKQTAVCFTEDNQQPSGFLFSYKEQEKLEKMNSPRTKKRGNQLKNVLSGELSGQRNATPGRSHRAGRITGHGQRAGGGPNKT